MLHMLLGFARVKRWSQSAILDRLSWEFCEIDYMDTYSVAEGKTDNALWMDADFDGRFIGQQCLNR